ncbi:TolC family protein [Roseovarius sp. MMSF_3281]|uniref:TolC family protein n=1 Tax=Roseovarius sp. MMSF_3281 TaxID=3046694 RepID=UPI00273D4DB3|nr:TolC family protein [Roseovarius sp. MMSF_3281]
MASACLLLAGCVALPEPDGMEAALIERAESLAPLAPAKGNDTRSVARNGLLRNPAVREAASLVSASADEVRVQRAALFPALGMSVGGGVGSAGDGKAVAELAGTQLLFDGGNSKRAIKIADFDMQISYVTFQKEVDTALTDLLETYDEVQTLSDLLGVYRKQLDALGELEEFVASRAASGAVPSTDVLETRRRLQSAAFLVNDTELALAEARDRLILLSGQSRGGHIGISSPSCKSQDATDDVLLARLELGRAQLASEQAQNALNPSVALKPIVRAEAGTDRLPVGLNLDVQSDLLQGGALSAKAKAARNTLAAAKARVDAAGLEESLGERGLLRSLAAGKQKRELLERQISLVSETRELYRSQYLDLGTRQLSELLDNEEEYYSRKAELVQLQSELARTRLECAVRSGRLRSALGLEGTRIYGYPLADDLL